MSAYDELRKAVEAALQNLESSGVDERTYEYLNEHFASDGDCPLVKLHKQLKSALASPARNCDKCNSATDAVLFAIDAGVVDLKFGAREMAEFLLSEAEGGAE